MKTVLYANDSSYAGISFIANHIPDSHTLFYMSVRKDFDAMVKHKTYYMNTSRFMDILFHADNLIIFSIYSATFLLKLIGEKKLLSSFKKITIIISDSKYVARHEFWNKFLLNNPQIKVLIMPDLLYLINKDIKYKAYYQHIPLLGSLPPKTKEVTIAHSPGLKFKSNLKGTKTIQRELKGLVLDIISKERWDNCIKRKAKAHFFIDQLQTGNYASGSHYQGGIGKSGLEAMLVGCLTLTSGIIPDTEPTFPKCPVVIVTDKTLRKTIDYYISNPQSYKEKVQEQQDWAKKYLSREFVLSNILE